MRKGFDDASGSLTTTADGVPRNEYFAAIEMILAEKHWYMRQMFLFKWSNSSEHHCTQGSTVSFGYTVILQAWEDPKLRFHEHHEKPHVVTASDEISKGQRDQTIQLRPGLARRSPAKKRRRRGFWLTCRDEGKNSISYSCSWMQLDGPCETKARKCKDDRNQLEHKVDQVSTRKLPDQCVTQVDTKNPHSKPKTELHTSASQSQQKLVLEAPPRGKIDRQSFQPTNPSHTTQRYLGTAASWPSSRQNYLGISHPSPDWSNISRPLRGYPQETVWEQQSKDLPQQPDIPHTKQRYLGTAARQHSTPEPVFGTTKAPPKQQSVHQEQRAIPKKPIQQEATKEQPQHAKRTQIPRGDLGTAADQHLGKESLSSTVKSSLDQQSAHQAVQPIPEVVGESRVNREPSAHAENPHTPKRSQGTAAQPQLGTEGSSSARLPPERSDAGSAERTVDGRAFSTPGSKSTRSANTITKTKAGNRFGVISSPSPQTGVVCGTMFRNRSSYWRAEKAGRNEPQPDIDQLTFVDLKSGEVLEESPVLQDSPARRASSARRASPSRDVSPLRRAIAGPSTARRGTSMVPRAPRVPTRASTYLSGLPYYSAGSQQLRKEASTPDATSGSTALAFETFSLGSDDSLFGENISDTPTVPAKDGVPQTQGQDSGWTASLNLFSDVTTHQSPAFSTAENTPTVASTSLSMLGVAHSQTGKSGDAQTMSVVHSDSSTLHSAKGDSAIERPRKSALGKSEVFGVFMFGPTRATIGSVRLTGFSIEMKKKVMSIMNASGVQFWFQHTITATNFKHYLQRNTRQIFRGAGQVLPEGQSDDRLRNLAKNLILWDGAALFFTSSFMLMIYPPDQSCWRLLDEKLVNPSPQGLLHFLLCDTISRVLPRLQKPLQQPQSLLRNGETAVHALVRHHFGISFDDIFQGERGAELPCTFIFLMYKREFRHQHDLIIRILSSKTKLTYSSLVGGHWHWFRKFVTHGIILMDKQSVEHCLHKIPGLGMATARRSINVFAVDLPAQDSSNRLVKLFPHGGTILLLDSLIVRKPTSAFRVIQGFQNLVLNSKPPEKWKMVTRLRVHDWLLDIIKIHLPDKPDLKVFQDVYQELSSLCPEAMRHPVFDTPIDESTLVCPRELESYDKKIGTVLAEEINKIELQHNDTTLTDWFGEWARRHVGEYKRFIIIHPDLITLVHAKLRADKKWQHVSRAMLHDTQASR